MSDNSDPAETPRTTTTTPHTTSSEHGGGARKWIIGAAAAALLVGGGIWAWNARPQQDQQVADAAYDQSEGSTDAVRAAAIPQETAPAASTASVDAAPPAATSSTRAATRTRRASTERTRTAAYYNTPAEATIGVTPASYASDSDDIIVPGARRPVWTATPSARRLTRLYPDSALQRGREGDAQLACTVQQTGRLACNTVSATRGGFGPAAQRVAASFRHATALPNGRDMVGTPVNLHVAFRLEENERERQRLASR